MISVSPEDFRKHTWEYFHIHASQRLTTFNFYIVISALLTSGLVATFRNEVKFHEIGIFLGLMLPFISFVFCKLDMRNRQLIQNAEAALKYLESQYDLSNFEVSTNGKPHILKLFSYEEHQTNIRKRIRSYCPWKNHFSYRRCFQWVFIAFCFAGIFGAIISLFKLLNPPIAVTGFF